MQTLVTVILPVFLVIGAGYLATWRKLITEDAIDGLMVFAQKIAIPCLLFWAIATLDLSQGLRPRLLASFFLGAFGAFAVGVVGARVIFRRPWQDCIAIGFVGYFSNSLLLGIPITERAFGPEALTDNYRIIAIHSPLLYGVGITAMEIARSGGRGVARTVKSVLKAMFSNALVIGIMLGFVVNLGNIPIPEPVADGLKLLTRAALPAALFGLGGVLIRYRPEGDVPTIIFAMSLSILLHPALTWGLGRMMGLSLDEFRSAVLTAAMAPGINTYIFANMYGAARRVAASAVLIGTSASILTIWFWLQVLP